mgnify:CR=1 FL=1
MTVRKRPQGKEFEDWCSHWDAAIHEEKLRLCEKIGVTYDTAKHWRSESGVPQGVDGTGLRMTVTISELFAVQPSVALDFVMFDIETSGFDADWDILLTACIKPYGYPPIVFRADKYPDWLTQRANDKEITRDIAIELRKHAIVVGHYSQRFDIRFLRAKMFHHGLEPLPPMFGVDTWKIAKDNFKVSNRRRGSLSIFAGLDSERDTPEGDRWMRATFNGEEEAMNKIVAHNIACVTGLEKLACISFPYLKSIPKL